MARNADDTGVGHNSGEAETKIDRGKFLAALRLANAADEKCRRANETRKKVREQLKADGFKLGVFDRVRKAVASEDEDKDLTADIKLELHYMQLAALPIGTQGTLWPDDVEPDMDEVEADGFRAGYQGATRKPPTKFEPKTQEWLAAYAKGQKALAKDTYNFEDFDKDDADAPAKADGPSAKKKEKAGSNPPATPSSRRKSGKDAAASQGEDDEDDVVPMKTDA